MGSTGPIHPSRDKPRPDSGLLAVTIAFTAFAFGLWLQPDRWASTPAYALLLNILPQQTWGSIYLALALLMGCALLWPRWGLVITAHTLAIGLTAAWWFAFVIRWITDDGTTIVNVVSWGTYLLLLVWSAQRAVRRPTAR